MKKLATLIIALIVLGSLPPLASANTNTTTETTTFNNMLNLGGSYSIPGNSTHTFTRDVNRGHVDVLITGDGSTDLDLYVYIGGRWLKSDSNSDDEKNMPRRNYAKRLHKDHGY